MALFSQTLDLHRRRLHYKGRPPRLHLLTAAPPVAPAAPGSVHVRVTAVLTPARGKRQTAVLWFPRGYKNDYVT